MFESLSWKKMRGRCSNLQVHPHLQDVLGFLVILDHPEIQNNQVLASDKQLFSCIMKKKVFVFSTSKNIVSFFDIGYLRPWHSNCSSVSSGASTFAWHSTAVPLCNIVLHSEIKQMSSN